MSFNKLWLLKAFLEVILALKSIGGIYKHRGLNIRFTSLFTFYHLFVN